MEIIEQRVVIYATFNGKKPFVEWLDSLRDTRATQRILARIARLRAGILVIQSLLVME